MVRRPLHVLRPPQRPAGPGARIVLGYAGLAVLVVAAAVGVAGEVPWAHPSPLLELAQPVRDAASVVAGLALAALVIAFTRVATRHFRWAKELADHLRPAAWSLSPAQIVAVAIASSVAEELLFRAVLVPWLGVVASSALFGLAHQMRGPSRWIWVAFSAIVGLGLGAIYASTGSLWGPIAAHATINAVNLAWLRAGEPPGRLGGRVRFSPV